MVDEELLSMYVTKAMHRIEKLYYDTCGDCYVAFSGGKDSTVILALVKMCYELGTIPVDSIPAVFCDTKIELDATYDFVKWVKSNWYTNLVILTPERPFAVVLKENGKPVKSKLKSELLNRFQRDPSMASVKMLFDKGYMRSALADKDMHLVHPDIDIKFSNACCEELKKKPFKKYAKQHEIKGYMSGERLAEGGARSTVIKRHIEAGKAPCTKISGKYIVKMPIVDWPDEYVDAFISHYNVKLSDAYEVYKMDRTGCCCCPFSLNIADDLKILYDHEPNKYKASLFWLKDVYIAQNVSLPFDEDYEKERKEKWEKEYSSMRHDMLKQYRPDCRLCKQYEKEKETV